MYRNLHARVEAVVPILDRSAKEKIWDLLQAYIKDQRQTWDMKSDGSYTRRKGEDIGVHQILMTQAKQRHTTKDGDHTEDES
jgi:polyphosphate kinase